MQIPYNILCRKIVDLVVGTGSVGGGHPSISDMHTVWYYQQEQHQ